MSVDFNGPAAEVFNILRAFNYEVVLYDADGNTVYEPDDARRFFCKPTNMLLSIVDDGDNSSMRLYIGASTNIEQIVGLNDTLRATAPKYNMLFNVRKYGREISPKDFSTKASVRENKNMKEPAKWDSKRDAAQKMAMPSAKKVSENVFEGMYGTTRSSYVKLENARMIVRHKKRVEENLIGSRGRNIDSIFVENAIGERTLFPVNNLSGARAMTQHVNQGGGFGDPVGQHILQMAENFANLATVSRHVQAHGASLDESAFDLRNNVRECMKETRRVFERMFRPGGYTAEAAKINERAATLVEGGEEENVNEFADKVDNLRGLLTVEGVEISETVLESVAKALHEMVGAPSVDEAARVKDEPSVMVLGRPVSIPAWEAFKQGHLDLMSEPKIGFSTGRDDVGGEPGYKSRSAELAHKLGAVVKAVKNDSMANFLSYVNDALIHEKDPAILGKLRRVAIAAVRAAGVPMAEGVALNSPVIKEYNDWINAHSPEHIFVQETDEEEPEEDGEELDEQTIAEVDDESGDVEPDEELSEGPGWDRVKRGIGAAGLAGAMMHGAHAQDVQLRMPSTQQVQLQTPSSQDVQLRMPSTQDVKLRTPDDAKPRSLDPDFKLSDSINEDPILFNWRKLYKPYIVEDETQLGTTDSFTFTANINGVEATVTATNHPASADDSSGSPAHIDIERIVTPDGQNINAASLGGAMMQNLQTQASTQYADRKGDTDIASQGGGFDADVGESNLMGTPAGGDAPGLYDSFDADIDVDEALMSMPTSGANPQTNGFAMGNSPSSDMTAGGLGGGEIAFGGCGDGDDGALTADDVIVPTNMGKDLEDEVTKKTTKDVDGNDIEVDPSYVERLRTLAGMNRY